MLKFEVKGNYSKTNNFLAKLSNRSFYRDLEKFAQEGVDALRANTPKSTGLTSESWYYKIDKTRNGATITWHNSNLSDGIPVAILIQYGHSTKNGAYVQGIDYINPALRPVFDRLAENVWKEVTK